MILHSLLQKVHLNKSLYIIHFTLYILLSTSQAQTYLLPSENIFKPITSNYFEPRIGLAYYPKTGYFKVDAGKSYDLILFKFNKSNFSFGTEFFMHALGLNIKEKRLPIDVADGYFGINFSFSDSSSSNRLRLRILHNSAHFVDGHSERNLTYQPKENYVNDFFDITFQKHITKNLNLFTIVNYPIIIHPKELHKVNLSIGFEILHKFIDSFWNNENNFFITYNIKLTPLPKYIGTNHLMTGIRFGNGSSPKVKIYFSFYNGENLFKQYYGLKVSEYSFGFYIE